MKIGHATKLSTPKSSVSAKRNLKNWEFAMDVRGIVDE